MAAQAAIIARSEQDIALTDVVDTLPKDTLPQGKTSWGNSRRIVGTDRSTTLAEDVRSTSERALHAPARRAYQGKVRVFASGQDGTRSTNGAAGLGSAPPSMRGDGPRYDAV